MSLKEDLDLALKAMSNPDAPQNLELDESGRCNVPVLMPASLISLVEGRLMVTVELSGTGHLFTLLTPLAAINGKPSSDFFTELFHKQFYADQVSGASLAIGGTEEVLVAVYHWMLDAITPDEFLSLFKNFVSASFDLIGEVGVLAGKERWVTPFHAGRPP